MATTLLVRAADQIRDEVRAFRRSLYLRWAAFFVLGAFVNVVLGLLYAGASTDLALAKEVVWSAVAEGALLFVAAGLAVDAVSQRLDGLMDRAVLNAIASHTGTAGRRPAAIGLARVLLALDVLILTFVVAAIVMCGSGATYCAILAKAASPVGCALSTGSLLSVAALLNLASYRAARDDLLRDWGFGRYIRRVTDT